ncbi:hypothetical protein [Maridesulfovibrio sp.]|uniref:hypothetical protein n=1 Tax=Maridesulfovibrio sp. TaxID=2795000 RepID=UPI0029F5B574|nr:hypothetical protein [Maridesulfovibrio sp.]
MRISSFGQNQTGQIGGFKLAEFKKETPTEAEAINTSVAQLGTSKRSQEDVEFQIEKAIRDSSVFLKNGLDKIFDHGEKLLAGRNSEEYREHITELSKAIKGQDFERAEHLIDKFYRGDSSKIITRVQNLAKAAEDNFWQNIEDGLGFLKDDGIKWTLNVDGEDRDDLSTFDLAKMAIEKSRSEVENFSSEDLSEQVNITRDGAVAHAKGKLENAGQNKYSEDATSVTHAATDYAKGKIFRTDDLNYEEDKEVLKDIDELSATDGVTEEQIDRLRNQNSRKADTFTRYMRGRTDSFVEHFNKLKLSASPRVVEEKTPEGQQTEMELQAGDLQLNNTANWGQSISIEGMLLIDPAKQAAGTKKVADQYAVEKNKQSGSAVDWTI